jgi:hypothetical protein
VFTSQPQDVEVFHAGGWLPGSMLGWRHDATGGCQVWVRLVAGSEELWTELECLRLPERHLSLAPEPGERASAAAPAAPRSDALERTLTGGLPAIRDVFAPSGRAAHPAGRRRSAQTAEQPVAGAGLSVVPAGRHRAPSTPAVPIGAGRHRAADTGTWAMVTDPTATAEMPRSWVEGGGRGTRPVMGDGEASPSGRPDLRTRPVRLVDAAPRLRNGHPDDTVGGF